MELKWPPEYIEAVNAAVNSSITHGVDVALDRLKKIEKNYENSNFFKGFEIELQRSITRNVIIALTLSEEKKAIEALSSFLRESRLDIFPMEEKRGLIKAIEGKLQSHS